MGNEVAVCCKRLQQCINTVTMVSPYELVFGKTMELPASVTGKNSSSYNYDDFAQELKENLAYGWKKARESLIERKIKNKTYFDQKNDTKDLQIKVGDKILVKNTNRSTKYDAQYVGPYKVVEITGPNTIKINRKNKIVRAHKDQLKKFKE